MTATKLVEIVHGWPHGNVNVFARVVHRHAGQWHPVLPADESTDTPVRSCHGTETSTIAVAPNESLCVCRHQFTVRIGDLAFRRDGQQGVVEGAVPRARFNPLTDAYADRNLQISGRFTEAGDFSTRYYDAVLPEPGKDLLCREIVPEANSRTHVEPSGITRQPSLAEGQKLYPLPFRVLKQFQGPGQRGSFFHVDRSELGDSDPKAWRFC